MATRRRRRHRTTHAGRTRRPTDNPDGSTWNGENPIGWTSPVTASKSKPTPGGSGPPTQWEVGTATIDRGQRHRVGRLPTDRPKPIRSDGATGPPDPCRRHRRRRSRPLLWRGWVDAGPRLRRRVRRHRHPGLHRRQRRGRPRRRPRRHPAVGASETVRHPHQPIARAIDWPTTGANFDASGVTVVATDLGGQTVDLLNLAADSGGGSMFGDVNGKLATATGTGTCSPADDLDDGTIGNQAGPYSPAGHLDRGPGRLRPVRPRRVASSRTPPAPTCIDASASDPPLIERHPPGSGLYTFGGPTGDSCPSAWKMAYSPARTSPPSSSPGSTTPTHPADRPVGRRRRPKPAPVRRRNPRTTDLETRFDVRAHQIGNRLLVTRGHTTMPRIAGVTLNAATTPDVVDLLVTANPRTPSDSAATTAT